MGIGDAQTDLPQTAALQFAEKLPPTVLRLVKHRLYSQDPPHHRAINPVGNQKRQYRRPAEKSTSALNLELIEKLKELRLRHPFWGYRQMTAWLRYREGLTVNRKRVQRLMRENGFLSDFSLYTM